MTLTSSARYAFVWALLLATSLVIACAPSSATRKVDANNRATSEDTAQREAGLKPKRTAGEETSLQTSCSPEAPIDNIEVDSSLSFADEARLVAVSDNVFLGRVVRRVEDTPLPEKQPLPTTSFAVEVEENIKGSLSGTVTVVQGGGCDPRYGRIALINNDPLLKAGEEAVFVTRRESPDGPYSLISHRSSHVRVQTDEQEARVVSRFQEAEKSNR